MKSTYLRTTRLPASGHSLRRAFTRWLAPAMAMFGLTNVAQPLDPETERASFRVLDGFEVQLFASEQQGALKPIQLRFDPDGRLWIVGSTVYPQSVPGEAPNDRVTILEDTDGDGRADRTTVFADGLRIPTGLELGDGGAYVGAGTELLHLRDTNGDGIADERRVVWRGFGTGDTHQTINSFTWGPSGELMMSQGLHAESRIETPWGVAELRQAGVWRFWPGRMKLEPFWTGAMGAHNPFGTAFDRWGQPFIFAGNGHGIYHLTQAMIDTDHFLAHPWLWNQGRKFGGADFVENAHWPEAHQGEVISGGYLHNSVERFRITAAGTSFSVERLPPLVESTNTAFRIVDVRFGPDGALYLADWCNPVIGHYQASFRHPDRDRTHGRIWRVTAKGRPLVPVTRLTGLPLAELLDLLKSPDRWQRQMAKRVLAARPAESVFPALESWWRAVDATRGGSREAIDHALTEALGVYASHEILETNLLQRLATATTPQARAYAARVMGHGAAKLPGVLDHLTRLVADPDPLVRLEAVVACSYVPDVRAVEVAAIATEHPLEPPIEYAFTQAVHALEPHWAAARARGELRFDGRPKRLEAFARATRGTDSARYAVGRLRRVGEVALDAKTVRELAELIIEDGTAEDFLVLLNPRAFTLGTNHHHELQGTMLMAAARASRARGIRAGEPAIKPLQSLLDSGSPEIAAGAAFLGGVWRMDSLRPRLVALSKDTARPDALRAASMLGLAGFADAESERLLLELSEASSSQATRISAISALAGLNPAAAAKASAALLEAPVDATRVRALTEALLAHREGSSQLRAALGGVRIAPENIDPMLTTMAESGRRDAELAAILTRASDSPTASGPAPVMKSLPAFLEEVRARGDRAKGAAIFQREVLGCVVCHSVDGTPGKIGPDLGALGTAQTAEFIVGALIEPQKEVKEGFTAHEIETRDGSVYQGYLSGETEAELSLYDQLSRQTLRFPKDQLIARKQLGSLMPNGLVDGLSVTELRDLVAYLAGLGRR